MTITVGTSVTASFTQGDDTSEITGTVTGLYFARLHGFSLPMVTIACTDGRTRHALLGHTQAVAPTRRFVRVLTAGLGEPGACDDSIFYGTPAEFSAAFGVPPELATHDEGETSQRTTTGEQVTVTWEPTN